jgi:DNA polymerase III subunit alpha
MNEAERAQAQISQTSLFDGDVAAPAPVLVDTREWTDAERLQHEKSALGFYLSGHPYAAYAAELAPLVRTALSDIQPRAERYLIAGIVTAQRVQAGRKGKISFVTLDDGKGSAEVVVFNEVYDASRAMLREDALVVVEVKVTVRMGDDGEVTGLRILAEQVYDLPAVRKRWGRRLKVSCNGNATAEHLQQILAPFRADGLPVVVHYTNGAFEGDVELPDSWRVAPDEALIARLADWLAPENVLVQY